MVVVLVVVAHAALGDVRCNRTTGGIAAVGDGVGFGNAAAVVAAAGCGKLQVPHLAGDYVQQLHPQQPKAVSLVQAVGHRLH